MLLKKTENEIKTNIFETESEKCTHAEIMLNLKQK